MPGVTRRIEPASEAVLPDPPAEPIAAADVEPVPVGRAAAVAPRQGLSPKREPGLELAVPLFGFRGT